MKKLRFILVMFMTTNLLLVSYAQEPGVIKPPKYPDGIYTKENTNTRRAIAYTYLREADVMWSKRVWRIIDLREKINHPLYYPSTPLADRKSLFEVIKDGAIKEGRETCFSTGDDEFRVELTKAEIEGLLSKKDTNMTDDPMNPEGPQIQAIIDNDINSDAITKYQLKEDWFFDKQRSVMDVRILGICPILEQFEEDGETFKGYKPLFWIYFPDNQIN